MFKISDLRFYIKKLEKAEQINLKKQKEENRDKRRKQ